MDYFKSIERLSDRSTKFPLMGISDHKKFFESDTFILIDAIFIDSKWRIDAENYFKIRYTYNNKSYSKKIPTRNNVLTITPDILCPEIIASKSEVLLKCQIEYVELDYGEITQITDKMKILYVPLRIKASLTYHKLFNIQKYANIGISELSFWIYINRICYKTLIIGNIAVFYYFHF